MGKEMDIRAKVVIGADGPTSTMARSAGMKVYHDWQRFDTCAQFQMAGIDVSADTADLYFGKYAPEGAVWILPKEDGFANIGLGMSGKYGKAVDFLRKFVKDHPELSKGSVLEVNAGIVPVGNPIDKFCMDGMMLVGDAARQVNPLTGGGLKFGIIAGRYAAETAKLAVDSGDASEGVLSGYQKMWLKEYGKQFKRWLKIRNIIYDMTDKELDKFFGSLGTIEIKDRDSKKDLGYIAFKTMGKVIMKNPKLMLKFGKMFK
jgi:digeranylgeranylglycerophospholipid reductase